MCHRSGKEHLGTARSQCGPGQLLLPSRLKSCCSQLWRLVQVWRVPCEDPQGPFFSKLWGGAGHPVLDSPSSLSLSSIVYCMSVESHGENSMYDVWDVPPQEQSTSLASHCCTW